MPNEMIILVAPGRRVFVDGRPEDLELLRNFIEANREGLILAANAAACGTTFGQLAGGVA